MPSRIVRVAVLLAAVALLCVALGSWGASRTELEVLPVRGGGEYGFQPNEAGVPSREQSEAMASLISASGGGEVLSAESAMDDQRRWLAPYFARKAAEARRRFGAGAIPSAVNLNAESVPLKVVSPQTTTFEQYTLEGSLPSDVAVEGDEAATTQRAKAPTQQLEEEAYNGPDRFAPQEPWDKRYGVEVDFAYADERRECLAGGDKREWDPVQHACLDGGEPAGEVDGSNEAWRAMQPKETSLVDMDWRYADLKSDCEGRGANYEWRPSEFPGRSGECWKLGKKLGLLPDGTEYNVPREMRVRAPARLQELADYFDPQGAAEPVPKRSRADWVYADQRHECEAQDVHHRWDDVEHICLYRGKKMSREKPAPGPAADAYQTWDMRRECLAAKAKHDGYEWDQDRARCVYWGKVPRLHAVQKPDADWKHFDIEAECTRRGKGYVWKPKGDGSGSGTCIHNHMPVDEPAVHRGRQWDATDYRLMDLRRSCEQEKNAEWRDGRCVKYSEPEWDQYGRRRREIPLSDEYSAPRTPPTALNGPVTPQDFKNNCEQKKHGVLHEDSDGAVLCISPKGCTVVDQFGSRFDCVAASAAAGEPRLFGTYHPKVPTRALADMFNPGGDPLGSNVKFTPPTVVDPKIAFAQTGVEAPLPIGDADLHGKDVGRFVQDKPRGPEWSEGVNRVNGERGVFFYNHATGALKFEGPKHAPLTCNEDTNGTDEVPGCNWERLVDLKSGEQYWKNLDSGEETWDDPLDELRPTPQLEQAPPRPGTWSGTAGGNPYWSPAFAQAALGSRVKLFDVKEGWVAPTCGGATGDCLGYVGKGKNLAHDFDKFHPSTAGKPFLRGSKGETWDEARRREREGGSVGALRQLPLRLTGRGKGLPWYDGKPYRDLVPSELGEAHIQSLAEVPDRVARQQRLAEIYGVKIKDSDARKFFGTDFRKQWKEPSEEETKDYLAELYAKFGNSTEEGTVTPGATWPEMPKFGSEHRVKGRTQWCRWQGSGGQMVPCNIGDGGAWYDDPVDTGIWRPQGANSMTMVGWGAWQLPQETARRQRRLAEGI